MAKLKQYEKNTVSFQLHAIESEKKTAERRINHFDVMILNLIENYFHNIFTAKWNGFECLWCRWFVSKVHLTRNLVSWSIEYIVMRLYTFKSFVMYAYFFNYLLAALSRWLLIQNTFSCLSVRNDIKSLYELKLKP